MLLWLPFLTLFDADDDLGCVMFQPLSVLLPAAELQPEQERRDSYEHD